MCLEEFDVRLDEIIGAMRDNDMIIVTADHGCDPTFESTTDHTREYVPFLAYGKSLNKGVNLGTRDTFSDIGQTVAELFGVEKLRNGESFLNLILG